MNHNDNHQRNQHNGQRRQRHDNNSAPTRRKLALDHPLLPKKVPPRPEQQRQDTDAQERGAKRLSQAPKRGILRVVVAVGDGGI